MENFMFEHNGKQYWYSRSMTAVNFVFCRNKNYEWCILANQRGPSAPSCVGLWNVPCGYLDHNESITEAACRETKEETGVKVEEYQLNFWKLKTSPDKGKQNMNCQFYVVLDGITDLYPVSDQFNEPGETSDIKWIPITEVDKYNFAFNQKPAIFKIYNNFVEPTMLRKIGLWFRRKINELLDIEYFM